MVGELDLEEDAVGGLAMAGVVEVVEDNFNRRAARPGFAAHGPSLLRQGGRAIVHIKCARVRRVERRDDLLARLLLDLMARSAATFAIQILNGSALGEGMDWIRRNICSAVATSVL